MTRPFLLLVLLLLLSTASAAVMATLLFWSVPIAQERATEEPFLVGIVLDGPRGLRAAMIRCAWPGAVRHDHLFVEGESVCGRSTLVEVLPAAVRLREASGERRLVLREAGTPSVAPTVSVEPSGVRRASVLAAPRVSVDGDRTTVTLTEDELRAYTSDMVALATEAVAAPRVNPNEPSRIDGFLITRVRPDGLLARIGIRDDDVAVSLNGSPLGSVTPILGTLSTLPATRRAVVGVERRGRVVTFEVRVE